MAASSMENTENNHEISAKPKASFFNRSFTMQSKPTDFHLKPYLNHPSFERAGSMKKLYNSFESLIPNSNSIKGKVKNLCNLFESSKPAPSQGRLDESQSQLLRLPSPSKLRPVIKIGHSIRLPGTEDRIVVYFTSLRGIRRTFEDCYAVRMIFRGFRVWVDERDVSMDLGYKKELLNALGEKKNVSLPQVFIGGQHVGGADVIKQLYETGELAKMLEKFPKRAPGFVCESCGDARFIPCGNCSGSRKVFDEDEGVLKRCEDCNENGLIKCPECCS